MKFETLKNSIATLEKLPANSMLALWQNWMTCCDNSATCLKVQGGASLITGNSCIGLCASLTSSFAQ